MKKFLLPLIIGILFNGCSSMSYQKPLPSKKKYRIINNKTIAKKSKKIDIKKLYNYTRFGIASYYGPRWHGRTTANGEKLNIFALTAAHKTLPFNTLVKVTDLDTGKSVVVRINDRGPYIPGRIIDLTDYAAKELGILEKGIAKVKIEVL